MPCSSLSTSSSLDVFYWDELSPVADCPINVFRVEGPKTLAPAHTHTYLEIAIVISGTGIYSSPDGDFKLQPGDVFLLGSNQLHAYTRQDALIVYNLLLQDKTVLRDHLELAQDPALKYFFELEPIFRTNDHFEHHLQLNSSQIENLEQILDLIKEELTEQGGHFREMVSLLLKRFLILLSRYHGQISDHPDNQLFALAKVLRHLERHYPDFISCQSMARLAMMPPRTFYRYFTKATGVAPMRYLLNLRLEKAKQLLSGTALSVKEIADKCGFGNVSYFGQQFLKTFNCSPAKYRREQSRNS